MKDILEPYFGLDNDLYEKVKDDPNVIPYNGKIRDYIKVIAMSTRAIDPEFYVKKLHKTIDNFKGDICAVSDW